MAGRKMKEEGNSGRERGEGRADTCCLPHCLSSPSSSLSFCVSSSSSHSCFLPLLLLSFPPRSVWNNPRDPLAEEEGEPFGRGDDKTIGSVKGELTFSFFLFFFFSWSVCSISKSRNAARLWESILGSWTRRGKIVMHEYAMATVSF